MYGRVRHRDEDYEADVTSPLPYGVNYINLHLPEDWKGLLNVKVDEQRYIVLNVLQASRNWLCIHILS
jgi:hypothetical protein